MLSRARSDGRRPDLIKTQLAAELRERILTGELQPGQIISETQWAPKLGAAQASVREALNLLVSEGLVQKEPGRSARVTNLTERDVVQVYRVRAVMEGLAARLAAEQRSDLSGLENAIEDMRSMAGRGNLRGAIEADLTFHLLLSEVSGNPFLIQQTRQLVIPLFAFTLIRALVDGKAAQAWVDAACDHQLILAGIRSGDPLFAEQSTRHVIGKFAAVAHDVWASEKPLPGTQAGLKLSGGRRWK
jgi:DNA-binding GntR family transcriptional regulator